MEPLETRYRGSSPRPSRPCAPCWQDGASSSDSGAAEPSVLVDAMVTHGTHLADNEIVHLMTLGPAPYVAPEHASRFRHTAFFIGANVRSAVQEGRADFMPVFLSDIPRLITSRRVRIDVALIQVSPPDAHGYCSLGVSVDVVRAAVDSADVVIAQVNPRMPRTLGDSFIHVDCLAHIVPVDYELPERLPEPLDEADRAIGEHVASLVPDGATLQLGIGRLPDAVPRLAHPSCRPRGPHRDVLRPRDAARRRRGHQRAPQDGAPRQDCHLVRHGEPRPL